MMDGTAAYARSWSRIEVSQGPGGEGMIRRDW